MQLCTGCTQMLHRINGLKDGVTCRYGELDVAAGLGGLSEKGIQDLRRDLAAVEADLASELQNGVHAQYPCFIAASQVCSKSACLELQKGVLVQEPCLTALQV